MSGQIRLKKHEALRRFQALKDVGEDGPPKEIMKMAIIDTLLDCLDEDYRKAVDEISF